MRGIASERFAVRNSGAVAVVEGVGDHGCEYMTGGVVLILGLTGRNFAAGMSGGVAYVWDIDKTFSTKCNPEMVELCKLEDTEDLELVQNLLHEFRNLTGSVVADKLIKEFNVRVKEFVKVFPYEYQRVLKQKAAVEAAPKVNNVSEPNIKDIEDSVADLALEQKKVERALDKLRGNVINYQKIVIYIEMLETLTILPTILTFPPIY